MTEKSDAEMKHSIERLTQEVERLNTHRFVRIHNSIWRLVSFQFVRGLAFGLGSVIGASLLVSMLVWWASQIEFIPVIGDWAAQLVEEIQTDR
ncbi:DUF5665 domain-containing protein [Lentibacter sp. XHP0401]|jgi:Domain of unknown function (DUF5665)|uniref:DUF5665 domain-containing protein n=1 Tax=Lentibacter sp. XHP0401 TaxID=2984334 RepID=UPI0021E939D8|nr:DUF5665 domain-containing protein [Lentibacter sp. XHP0401]MCV2893576.1 DUF5665 domain-containing protein [Lentibacter sp. XHP0401]